MATPVWQPGTLYSPGALVRPRSAPAVDVGQPDNPGFEAGNVTGWTVANEVGGDGTFQANDDHWLSGTWCGEWVGGAGSGSEGGIEGYIVSSEKAAVNPGQTITGKCYILYNTAGQQAGSRGQSLIAWYDDAEVFISYSRGNVIAGRGNNGRWVLSTVVGTAPANAAFASMGVWLTRRFGNIFVDDFSWDYAYSGPPDGLIFRATQADAGFSGNIEPAWPDGVGETVVDNEVTWEGVLTSRVVWEAEPILVSGPTEPLWPILVGGTVVDNTIAWRAISRRIEDERCPQSKVVAIAASKIFAADDDIIAFSATVNPLDWSTVDDAGYIPFGLNTFGSNPVAALGLYRGNLVAFNSEAFQMWQVDQDPANMAILDAVPVSCTFPASVQSVANDLVFLNPVGVRNINIAGASTNLQAGQFGEAVDPLVTAKINLAEFEPLGLYYPARGQYWLVFGPEAFVLTINGTKDQSWSRYVFPEEITDWTLHGDQLYLRTSTGKVWNVSHTALQDDVYTVGNPSVLSGEVDGGDNILTWTAVDVEGGPAIHHYELYRSVGPGSTSWVQIGGDFDPDDPLTYTDNDDLVPLQTYRYKVIGLDTRQIPTADSNIVDLVAAEDEHAGDVVVLLQAHTGALVEASGLPTVTVAGAGALSTLQAKFGTHSFRNPGTNTENTNYVRLEDTTDGQGLFIFPGEFTIEGWFYIVSLNSDQYNNMFANSVNFPGTGFTQLAVRQSPGDLFWNSAPGGGADSVPLVPIGQWTFLAVTRDASDVFRMFIDGVKVFEGTKSGTMGGPNAVDEKSSLDCCRGHASDNADMNCYFDQVRMTKACRYTADFTPPTAPFPGV